MEQKLEQGTRRRPRVRPDEPVAQRVTRTKAEQMLTETLERMEMMAAMAEQNEAARIQIMAYMKANKLTDMKVAKGSANISHTKGRATNTIDPKGFHELCESDKDFYSAISVSVTKAKEVVASKALERITTSVPGTVGPDVLKIEPLKTKE